MKVLRKVLSTIGADSIEHGGIRDPPTFTNGWARGGGIASRRTANKKLSKLY